MIFVYLFQQYAALNRKYKGIEISSACTQTWTKLAAQSIEIEEMGGGFSEMTTKGKSCSSRLTALFY